MSTTIYSIGNLLSGRYFSKAFLQFVQRSSKVTDFLVDDVWYNTLHWSVHPLSEKIKDILHMMTTVSQ
jgi:hypothetical protein